jgi:hypothetical protein
MREPRKNPVWPWIVVFLIGVPVLYVTSFGPACWLVSRQQLDSRHAWRMYKPLIVAANPGTTWIGISLKNYATLWGYSEATYRRMVFKERLYELRRQQAFR